MRSSQEGYLWTRAGATTGLTTDAAVDGTPSSAIRTNYDVVIIGAGFSGLIAARNLSRSHNLKVLIVEGRDRIGGRTWTAKALGEEFEMGGTWVHWNQPHLYSELHRYGLHRNLKTSSGTADPKATMYTGAFSNCAEINGDEVAAASQRAADAFFSIDGLSSRQLMPYPHEPYRQPALWVKYDRLSVQDRLDQLGIPQIEKDLFGTIVSSYGSAPNSEISFTEVLRWYALSNHSFASVNELCGTFKLGKGGMTSLARCILSECKGHLLLNTVVDKIEQTGNSVLLSTKSGKQIRAKQIISTIPLNCLSDVHFSPPLSKLRQEAVSAGHINKGAKVHFHLEKCQPGWFSMANAHGKSPWCFAFSDHNGTNQRNGTYCIGFGYNNFLQDPHAHNEIIKTFKQFIKPDAEVKAYLTHDWMNDPLAKGVWSCWGPGGMSRWLRELQTPYGRILFASADWADGWRGFIDGAIEQGVKAASQVEQLLGEEINVKL